jgi:hypothetical protein
MEPTIELSTGKAIFHLILGILFYPCDLLHRFRCSEAHFDIRMGLCQRIPVCGLRQRGVGYLVCGFAFGTLI